MSPDNPVPVSALWEIFQPDFVTGSLKWKPRASGIPRIISGFNSRHAGQEALTQTDERGYLFGTFAFNGRRHFARKHRVLWAMAHGRWPHGDVDHADRVTSNNCLENLREATRAQNCQNLVRTNGLSGYKGVDLHDGKWRARIHVLSRSIHLGHHPTEEAAAYAYDTAARRHFGEFAHLNFPGLETNTAQAV